MITFVNQSVIALFQRQSPAQLLQDIANLTLLTAISRPFFVVCGVGGCQASLAPESNEILLVARCTSEKNIVRISSADFFDLKAVKLKQKSPSIRIQRQKYDMTSG